MEATPLRVRAVGLAARPALLAAICVVLGILFHEYVPIQPGWCVLAAACLAGASLLLLGDLPAGLLLAVAIVLLGCGAAQTARYRFAADEVALYTGTEPRLASVRVRLDEAPRLLRTPDTAMPRSPRHVALVTVTAVQTWSGWQAASGEMLLQINEPVPFMQAGQHLELTGLLERPGEAMNPGQFDYAAYYRAQGILASMSVNGPGNVHVLSHDPAPLLTRWRDRARGWLVAGFGPRQQEEAALLRVLLLGERDPVMSDVRESFRRSGTSHYLAISGLHIALVGGMVLGLMRFAGFGPRLSLAAGVAVVVVYGTLALPSPPVIRATVLAVAFGIGLIFGRRTGGLQLLGVAALFVLLGNPLDLYRAGFQLSFVTVLGLMLLSGPVLRRLNATADSDAEILRLQRDRVIFRVTHWLDGRMSRALTSALVAWIVSMPLVTMHFEQFNPWAIPASLAAAPFVFLTLAGGVLKLVLTALVPDQAQLWAQGALWPVQMMRGIVEWFAARPLADVPLPKPSLLLVACLYASVALWLVKWPGAMLKWAGRSPAVGCYLLVFIFPFTGSTPSLADQPLRVTVLAVGAGLCIVVETPAGRVAMYDAGSTSLGDPVVRCVSPFLRSRGYARVDQLMISHAHWDHYGGAAELVRRYGVSEVLVGDQFGGDAAAVVSGRRMLEELAHLDRPPRRIRAGDVVPLGRATTLEVLWPPADATGLSTDDASLVVRLTHAGRTILLTGDIQEQGMRQLLALEADAPGLLRADLLIAPHHGSSEASTARFIDAVDPDWIISSNGRTLAQKQRRLAELTGGRPLLRTHQTGGVTISIDAGGELEVSTHLGSTRRSLVYQE